MTNRELIESLRGAFVERVVGSATVSGVLYEVVGFGYEHYERPQFYSLRVNGEDVLMENGTRVTSYWNTDISQYLGNASIEFALNNSMRDFEW